VEVSLHQVYGIDVGDKELMKSRSWRWLSLRIIGLLMIECPLQRKLNPQDPKSNTPVR